MNKKGYSTGFAWVFALVSLFGLGILYIVFNQVLSVHIAPVMKEMVNTTMTDKPVDEATRIEIHQAIDRYMAFFNALPFILFFVIVLFMIVTAIRREGESEYR